MKKKRDVSKPIQMKPKPNCKDCFGRGYVLMIPPNLDANKYREARPCHCVKAIVDITEGRPQEAESKIL